MPNTEEIIVVAKANVNKTDVGLGNCDNVSDSGKPISTAQQTALDTKVPISRTINGQALSSNVSLTSSDVGLGNVNNTSDVNKPVSTAQATAIANAGMLQLLATGASINGATLATTALTYESGKSLATHSPTHIVFKYISGTLGINVTTIDAGSAVIATGTLATLSSTINNLIMPVTGFIKNSGNISAIVATASLGAAVFSVFVYGIVKP